MLHIMRKLILLFSVTCLLFSCKDSANKKRVAVNELLEQQDSILSHTSEFSDTVEIHYAKGLKVEYLPDGIHVTITNPDPTSRHSKPEHLVITKPASRFICTTALQAGNFEVLNLEDRIVGINTLKNLFSPKIAEQIEHGKTIQIGKEGNFDIESVLATQPDYIFVSASKHGGFEVLKDCGIPLISHHGYKETNPLGQAEWIKLIGLLTGETRRANAMFAHIEEKYNKLKEEVIQAQTQTPSPLPLEGENGMSRTSKAKSDHSSPMGETGDGSAGSFTICSGRQIRDGWYAVGGQSYMARIFRDAGATYIMCDNEESGGMTLDFETAYARSMDADFWQIDGSFDGEFTMATLADEDPRYATLNAYKKGQVLFCNLSSTPYRELGGVLPHLLLSDFVKAFHPELLPDYEPTFYRLLK